MSFESVENLAESEGNQDKKKVKFELNKKPKTFNT